MIDFIEDTVMFCACFLKNIVLIVVVLSFGSYLYHADGSFSIAILLLGLLFLYICYKFYIKSVNSSRDVLLDILEKKGRKELLIEDDAKSFKLFKKVSSCASLPAEPANAKEFSLTIIYVGKKHLTIYKKCPKSHIYKIYKKKASPKAKAKPVQACAENREYYYSQIQGVHFDKDMIISLISGEPLTIEAAKGPAAKAINKIRSILRDR